MPVTDPVADMLTSIRNANIANKDAAVFPASKLKAEIARVLVEEGYLANVETVDAETGKPRLKVTLKLAQARGERKVLTGIKRVSKPGLRVYAGKTELPKVLGGLGIAILSTPKGVMTDRAARKAGVGGEVLAFVW